MSNNDKVHQSFDSVSKYTIKAHDSVIAARLMIVSLVHTQSLFFVFPQKYLKERSILNYVVF